jgi:arabinogalactan endo-1,4-beta-galactosidase
MKKTFALLIVASALALAGCGNMPSSGSFSSNASSSASSGAVSSASFPSYSNGGTTNSEAHDYDNIIVNGPTKALSSSFMYGVDCSIVHDIESLGGRYYNEQGREEDIFKILAADGVNYARFRVWVDPYNAIDGKSYGGGANDTATDIYLAERASAAGLKVMLDFHYSDFWTDPSHYWAPKVWSSLPKSKIAAALGTYTTSTLQAFKDAGVTVSAVQIGNEINTGLAGVASSASVSSNNYFANMIKAGIAAAKGVFPAILTSVHLTNIKSASAVYELIDSLVSNGCAFDQVGISYYPYWHGTKANLQAVLNTVAASTGKPVFIAETGWGFTDEQTDYATNQFSTSGFGQTGGYLTSEQGQLTETADLVDILSQVPNQKGIGIFYWEPDWLPVEGSYWATKAGEYYNDKGADAATAVYEAAYSDSSQKQSWANQAWFSYTGKALSSASVYRHLQNRDKEAPEVVEGLVKSAISLNVNLKGGSWAMPSTVQGYTNTGAYRDLAVVWDATAVAAITVDGTYPVAGTADGFAVTATVVAESNFVQDYSFEKQAMSGDEAAVSSPWAVLDNTAYGAYGTGHIESKGEGDLDGTKYYHWYNSVAFTWNLEQTLTVDWTGVYRLRTHLMSNVASGYTKMNLWIQVGGGAIQTVDCLPECAGWSSDLAVGMKECVLSGIEIPTANTSVTFGMDCAGKAASWGHLDLWSLVKVGDQ